MPDTLYPVTVPKWGIEMQEGTITGWQVASGSAVEKGDELIDIETDKIVNTMEAPVDGVLCRQIAEEGDTLKVGELLGVIATADATDADIDAFIEGFVPADASFGIDDEEESAPEPAAATPAAAAVSAVRVSPVAKRLALKLGIDLSTVVGTGRNGRISKEDVEAAVAGQSAKPTSAAIESFTSRRKTIAKRLVAAKQDIPHYYLTRSIGARNLLALKSPDVSLNAGILKAVSLALAEHPRINCHVLEDAIELRSTVDINMAVDTEQGLSAPLLRDVNHLSLPDLTRASADLAERSRANVLNAKDLELGGFTVSNLGALGIEAFTAIINPPQAAILAVGAVVDRQLKVTLSADHRVIDGADGARFLQTLAARMEDIRE